MATVLSQKIMSDEEREYQELVSKGLCKLQIMSINGDDPVFYNPKSQKDLDKTIKVIVEFLKKKYRLYGAYSKGTAKQKELKLIADEKDLEAVSNLHNTLNDKALDRFLLASPVGNKTVLMPQMKGG